MNDNFRAILDAKIADYRKWSLGRCFSSCRWVQYTGVEVTGALDVRLDEVERRLENAICEGFRVAWAEHQGQLYLRVWEGEDEPSWANVFAEESLGHTS
jgi:hypothetical protein